ncbi:hypothetical protein Hypma_013773 [Hypsizygus marmoreus]|uniref:Uncharacterized protein n=1 Tax=Hypsizygus marmoreus TaxID=39966 RepID=A0A369KGG1_HYPMA|nr:hypothetical protein Hypma_013773 [Hypsizygus marmoreus]
MVLLRYDLEDSLDFQHSYETRKEYNMLLKILEEGVEVMKNEAQGLQTILSDPSTSEEEKVLQIMRVHNGDAHLPIFIDYDILDHLIEGFTAEDLDLKSYWAESDFDSDLDEGTVAHDLEEACFEQSISKLCDENSSTLC